MYYSYKPQTQKKNQKGNVFVSTSVKRNSDHPHNYQSNQPNTKNSKYHIRIDDEHTKSELNLNLNISVNERMRKQNENQYSFSKNYWTPQTQTQPQTQRIKKPQYSAYIPQTTQRKYQRKQKQFGSSRKSLIKHQIIKIPEKQENRFKKIEQNKQIQKEPKRQNSAEKSFQSSRIMSQFGETEKPIPQVFPYDQNQLKKKDYKKVKNSDQRIKRNKKKEQVLYKKPTLQQQVDVSQRIFVPKTIVPRKVTTVSSNKKLKTASFRVKTGSIQENQQLFDLHKNRYLDRLRDQSKKKLLNKTLSKRSNSRSMSPQCQRITERLYYSSINKQPCAKLEKQIRFCKRKKMQQILKQYTFLKRYLTENQIHDILEEFERQGLPQYKWPMKMVELVQTKIYHSKRK